MISLASVDGDQENAAITKRSLIVFLLLPPVLLLGWRWLPLKLIPQSSLCCQVPFFSEGFT